MRLPFFKKKNPPSETSAGPNEPEEQKGSDEPIDTTIPQASGVRYLKGDEIILNFDGHKSGRGDLQFSTVLTKFLLHNPLVDRLGAPEAQKDAYRVEIRRSLAFWPSFRFNKSEALETLKTLNTPENRQSIQSRQKRITKNYEQLLTENYRHPAIWAPKSKMVQLPPAKRETDLNLVIKNHRKHIKHLFENIGRKMQKCQSQLAKETSDISINSIDHLAPPPAGRTLTDAEYQKLVEALEADQKLLPESFKILLAENEWPIIIRKNFRDAFELKKPPGLYTNNSPAWLNDPSFGTWVDAELLEKHFSTTTPNIKERMPLIHCFIEAVMVASPITLQEMGIENEQQWREILDELFLKDRADNSQLDKKSLQEALHAQYRPADALKLIHYAKHFISTDEDYQQKFRKKYPKAAAMYERFEETVKARAESIKESKNQAGKGARKTKQQPPATPQSRTEETPAPPSPIPGWRFDPRPFTDEPLEGKIIEQAQSFVEDSLKYDPPYNQCHVRLSPRSGRNTLGHPIEITMRNYEKETRKVTIFTGTDDLLLSQMLKMHLQSHLLSHPDIEPLWMSRLHKEDKPHLLTPDEIIPGSEPLDAKLVNHFSFFAAEFTFQEPKGINAGTFTLRIPLGLDYKPGDSAMSQEAQERLNLLEEYLQQNLKHEPPRWATVTEAAKHLKDMACHPEHPRPFRWRAGTTMPVEGYGGKDSNGKRIKTDLGFPITQEGDAYPQRTTLTGANLRLEKGPEFPNPRWRLHLTMRVDGLGPTGSESSTWRPTINLHTEDELTAQYRAVTAIESLKNIFLELSTNQHFENMRWHEVREDGTLIIADKDGRQPDDPFPRNSSEVMADTTQFQTNFEIIEVKERKETDQHIHVTLGVNRCTEERGEINEFMVPGKAVSPEPMRLEFSIPVKEADKIPDVIASLNQTFQNYLLEAFSNRTVNTKGEETRKSRDHYNPFTIQNLFFEVFATEMNHGTAADSLTPLFARYKGHVYREEELTGEVIESAEKSLNAARRKIRPSGEKYPPMFEDPWPGGKPKKEATGLSPATTSGSLDVYENGPDVPKRKVSSITEEGLFPPNSKTTREAG